MAKRIRSAVTDTGREVRFDREAKPGVSNLLGILAALTGTTPEAVAAGYEGKGYGDLKADVAEVVLAELEPFQQRFHELLADPAELDRDPRRGRGPCPRGGGPDARPRLRPGGLPARRTGRGPAVTTSWDRAARDPGTLAADGDGEAAVTLGVAVAVPEPFAGALRDGRARTGDPAAGAVPPHVTVVPPVQVAPDRVDEVVEHVRAVAARLEPFVVTLVGTGTFRPVSDVVFVQVVDGARACDRLQEQVRTGPLERRLGFPYHPHVTVAHDVPAEAMDSVQGQLADFRAAFDVQAVSVYRCGDDGVWRVLAEAPLAGCATEPGEA